MLLDGEHCGSGHVGLWGRQAACSAGVQQPLGHEGRPETDRPAPDAATALQKDVQSGERPGH